LEQHKNIHLFFLPPYSPEYNPAEIFWCWIKPKVYGFSALGGLNELISRFRKYVLHYNRKRLPRPISFNFKTYGKILQKIYAIMLIVQIFFLFKVWNVSYIEPMDI